MKRNVVDVNFWNQKKVFLTGHTGFKGGWLALWLVSMGAKVTGYALAPSSKPSLYEVLGLSSLVEHSYFSDIRDLDALQNAMTATAPDIVIHMAAQPLVRYSYANPVETYGVNVMGTVHILESVRQVHSVRAVVVVTSDKCYENKEWEWGYRENEPMGGYDPYSNSKGCAELIVSAYRQSYFSQNSSGSYLASARAGNVIGGGDWSGDRLIADAIKAFEADQPLIVRNPSAIRPWQHVLEPLSGYLMLAESLYERGGEFASGWNFGPHSNDNCSVKDLLDLLTVEWGGSARFEIASSNHPHEAHLLKLDSSKARSRLGWAPRWGLDITAKKIVEWQRAFQADENMRNVCLMQIKQYMNN